MPTYPARIAAVLVSAAVCVSVSASNLTEPADFRRGLPDDERILHALNRLTYGPRPGDAEAVRKLGLKKWIDRQLHPERIPENPELLARLEPLDTLRMSARELAAPYPAPPLPKAERPVLRDVLTPEELAQFRRTTPQERIDLLRRLPTGKLDRVLVAMPQPQRRALLAVAPPELRRELLIAGAPQRVIASDLADAKVYRALYSNRQLQELLVDFWFNHFNVFLNKGADRYLTTEYERDAIRPHVFGHFRDLLEATAKSPAMLFYLDNWQSVAPGAARNPRRGGLNENYGRELLELHTLGVDGGYTQKDVTEVARCFTGWTIRNPGRGGEFFYNDRVHDKGEKTVLGVRIPAGGGMEDGERVLDILAHQPATARFISTKLAQRFVADHPPEPLVDRMAAAFARTNGDLRKVMAAMLNSREFWSLGAYRSKIKSPLEFVASALRATATDVTFGQAITDEIGSLGEPLYAKEAPTGYSNDSVEWVNSSELLGRMNFAVALTAGRVPGTTVLTPATAVQLGSPEFQRK